MSRIRERIICAIIEIHEVKVLSSVLLTPFQVSDDVDNWGEVLYIAYRVPVIDNRDTVIYRSAPHPFPSLASLVVSLVSKSVSTTCKELNVMLHVARE